MGFDCWRGTRVDRWGAGEGLPCACEPGSDVDLRYTRGVWSVVSLRHSQQSTGVGDASHLVERRKGKLTLGSLNVWDAPRLTIETCAMLPLLTVCRGVERGSCSELVGESEWRGRAGLVDGDMPGRVSGGVRTRGYLLWFIKTPLSSGLGRSKVYLLEI